MMPTIDKKNDDKIMNKNNQISISILLTLLIVNIFDYFDFFFENF